MKKVIALIPCYNEEEGIADVIKGFPRGQLIAHGYSLEIVVIDNNSTDNTAAVARAAGAHVIFEPKQGKGNAIRAGFYYVPGDTDYVVMLDGDYTYRPQEIVRLLEPISSGFCNVVIGSRLGGRITNGSMTALNRFGNWIFSHLVRYSYRVNVTDVLTGYFAWDKNAISLLRPHLKSNGFAIEMEMITKMARLGEQIYSVPISYKSRAGNSSLRPVRDGLRILLMYFGNLRWMPKPKRPRRIVFVSDAVLPYHRGGKEKRLYEVSRRLAAAGLDVHIYTMKWWDGPRQVEHDGVTYHAISRLYPLYKNGRRSTREAVMFGFATYRMLFKRFDIMDVDSMPFFPLFSARIVTWLRRKPLYATWHEVTDLQSWQKYIGTAAGLAAWCIERVSMRASDAIISVSKQTTGRLRANGVKRPVITVPLGVDLNEIYHTKPSAQTSDVIFAGRLVAHKNVDLLIQAIASVRKVRPDITATIVGNGPEKANLAQLVEDLGLQNNVRLVGFIEEDADVYSLLKASKMFVLPSIREGFSAAAIEANAAGIPVITTTHPDNAARELIVEKVNGYLVEPLAESIASAILEVLKHKDPMQPGQGINQYDWDHVAENIKKALAI